MHEQNYFIFKMRDNLILIGDVRVNIDCSTDKETVNLKRK